MSAELQSRRRLLKMSLALGARRWRAIACGSAGRTRLRSAWTDATPDQILGPFYPVEADRWRQRSAVEGAFGKPPAIPFTLWAES
jgi:hypothetical protein